MQASLVDLLRGGIPALLVFALAIALIRIVCRRPVFRRLSFALSVRPMREPGARRPARTARA